MAAWNQDLYDNIAIFDESEEVYGQFVAAGSTNTTSDGSTPATPEPEEESGLAPAFEQPLPELDYSSANAQNRVCTLYATLNNIAYSKKIKNLLGGTTALIMMKKRWCRSTAHGSNNATIVENRVDSWWSEPKLSVTIPNSGSIDGWKAGATDDKDDYYYPRHGSNRGGHYSMRRQNLEYCPVRFGICDDKYVTLKLWVHSDGTYKERSSGAAGSSSCGGHA